MNNFAHRNSRLRRSVTGFGLAAALAITALGLSQCRMVQDSVTGVNLRQASDAKGRADCVHQCNDAFRAARRAEDRRHSDALKGCGNDTNCAKDENRRNQQNEKDLVRQMQECKRNCYNEGGGKGGR